MTQILQYRYNTNTKEKYNTSKWHKY